MAPSRLLVVRHPSKFECRTLGRLVSIVTGSLAGLVIVEGVLRIFVSTVLAPSAAIRADTLDGPAVVTRQIEEGIATASFSPGGARLTGIATVPGAPNIVIVGDSYVVAREVSDAKTMGAQLEKIARLDNVVVNIRQYGWRGASPARYVQSAAAVMERWHPVAVIVPLSNDDFDERATDGAFPRLRIDSAGKAIVVSDPAGEPAASPANWSVLGSLIAHRWTQIMLRAPRRFRQLPSGPNAHGAGPSDRTMPLAMIPRATVRALKAAYGEGLVLLYVADVRASGGQSPDEFEVPLLAACNAERVTCRSARSDMVAARASGEVVRGFSTTTLGIGHLNGAGHRLIAEQAWLLVRSRLVRLGPA
jgi:hypothetical protein